MSKAPPGIVAVELEMARQFTDALLSFDQNRARAKEIADSLRQTGQLLLLGMGGSHFVGRQAEHWYRAAGIDAIALPLSEQLGAPLRTNGRTVLLASQSGESAEVVRWLAKEDSDRHSFGLTLSPRSTLGTSLPSLVGAGGMEMAYAATRSLTISFALHLAVLNALAVDVAPALDIMRSPQRVEIRSALDALSKVGALVTSGRSLHGLAEALALGLTELARLPVVPLEGGQLRHGPMEALGPGVGVILFRSADETSDLVSGLARSVVEAGSPTIVFDASGDPPVPGAAMIAFPRANGPAAVFAMLPATQRLMIEFATARLSDAGTPRRSAKITRTE